MALFTGTYGLFEITALSFTPTSLVWGENVSCTVTITNKSGATVRKPYIVLNVCYKDYGLNRTGHYESYFINVGEYESTTAWKNNASITVTISGQVKSSILPSSQKPDAFTSRELPAFKLMSSSASASVGAYLHVCDLTDGSSVDDFFYNLYGADHEYLAILDKYYSPAIAEFEVGRTGDEDTTAWTTLKLSVAEGLTTDQRSRMTYSVYLDGTDVTSSIDTATFTLDVLEAGITKNTSFLSGVSLSTEADHVVKIVFGDKYESKPATCPVLRSFANMHLSGYAEGGVCFGGFCSDDRDANNKHIAKFECYYPAYFYGGIQGGTKGGITDAVTVKQNYKEVTVTFPTAFDTGVTPLVMVCMDKAAQDSDRYISLLSAFVVNGTVTNTGFTARVCSNSSNSYSVRLRWIAMAV